MSKRFPVAATCKPRKHEWFKIGKTKYCRICGKVNGGKR